MRLARISTNGGPDQDSELVILEVAQPFSNHNGGRLLFGPDGFLYLSLCDGGSRADPQGNGQNLATLLGTIIRLDVANASPTEPYVVPPSNPFLTTPGARPEILAYGFRNPCACPSTP
jgi:glucose/arabinose dehydrogenase